MPGKTFHPWNLSASQAISIQRRLARKVRRAPLPLSSVKLVAGCDIAYDKRSDRYFAGVVVLSLPQLEVIEEATAGGRVRFPYIPGLLSFRETPLVLAACEGLTVTPDLFIADAQGIAHPRRLGLASHLGLFLDIPTIGCAKSILCGRHEESGPPPGSYAPLFDGDEIIGAALRTKQGTKPVYVSVGHRVDLEAAIHWVVFCCRGYRLPEPTRLADQLSKGREPQPAPPQPSGEQPSLF